MDFQIEKTKLQVIPDKQTEVIFLLIFPVLTKTKILYSKYISEK